MKRHLKTTLIVIIAFGPLFSLISMTMAEVGWIEGTVTDVDTGLPLEGATVSVDGYSNVTNASGFYSIEVSPGTYNVTAEMTGYVSQTVADVSVSTNETVVQGFALSPNVGWVEGNVTDVYTGLPLEGVTITVNGYSDYTNASGFYRFELFPGTYNVTAQMKGYVSPPTGIVVYIYANMTTTLDFDLLPSIESSDVTGNPKDTFFPIDEIYVTGFDYSPSTTYHLYVVEDAATWIDGMDIPPRVNGTATTVSSDASGYIPPTLVWNDTLVIGKYDIVVDVNNNSVYDDGIDDLDDSDIEVTAGFHVIPEFQSFLILPLFMITTLLAVIVYRRKRSM